MPALQFIVTRFMNFTLDVFFSEAEGLNTDNVPAEGPVLFVCAPHANQFLDPGMVMKTCGRNIGYLIASVSMKRKFVGTMARALNAIPVDRPQDFAKKGTGTIKGEGNKITGEGTLFTQEAEQGATISLKGAALLVETVVSDTELLLKSPLKAPLESTAYKIIPKIEQADVYETVYDRLGEGGCVGIFPEGGSHDRTDLLPMKAGFAIMALGAKLKYPNIEMKIIPVGLNYFRAHAFRSSAYIDYGTPIIVTQEQAEMFKKGGADKRKVIASLLEQVDQAIKSVTVIAPDYETLQMYQSARRLYKPKGVKLSANEKLRINRAFAEGYKNFQNEPEVLQFKEKYLAYRAELKKMGLKDHQVKRIKEKNPFVAFILLIVRLMLIVILVILALPGLVLTAPIALTAIHVSRKKAREATASSSVKIAGRDVLATWKVFIGLGLTPALWLIYTAGAIVAGILIPNIPLWARIVIPVGSFILIPFIFYGTIIFFEQGRDLFVSLRPLFFTCLGSRTGEALKSMREELKQDVRLLVEKFGPRMFEDFDKKRVIAKDNFEDSVVFNPLHEEGESSTSFSSEKKGEEEVKENKKVEDKKEEKELVSSPSTVIDVDSKPEDEKTEGISLIEKTD